MSDDNNFRCDPTKSVTVPIFYLILATVLSLTWFFGGWVLAVFLTTTLLRHRNRCALCQAELAEADLHFEYPAQPLANAEPRLDWGPLAGRFFAARRSRLHRSLVHGAPVPEALAELCAGCTA